MKGEPLAARKGLGPLEEPACADVSATYLLLLLIAQGEDPESEHFVDLCPVEKVKGTLGRHLRVVRQDDGCCQ